MTVLCGYINATQANGGTPVVATPVSGAPAAVTLSYAYYPLDIGNVLGLRPSFDGAPVPFMLRPGTTITVSRAEANALLSAGMGTGA